MELGFLPIRYTSFLCEWALVKPPGALYGVYWSLLPITPDSIYIYLYPTTCQGLYPSSLPVEAFWLLSWSSDKTIQLEPSRIHSSCLHHLYYSLVLNSFSFHLVWSRPHVCTQMTTVNFKALLNTLLCYSMTHRSYSWARIIFYMLF